MDKAPRFLIIEALENLDEPEYQKFIARLQDPRGDGLSPRSFRKAQVKGKTRLEIAERLWDSFALNAVPIAVKLLKDIEEYGVAQSLEYEAKKRGCLPPSSDGASGSAAQDKKPAVTADEEHFVDRHRDKLIDRVTNTAPIFDYLFQKKILQQEQYDEAMEKRTKQAQMRFLLTDPLRSGGKRSKDVLLDALKALEPCLIEDLKENEG